MERYEESALRGKRGEERPRGPACWVAIQRLRGVTGGRRSIIQLYESALKACDFPLWACKKMSTKRTFTKPPVWFLRVQEKEFSWQEVVIDLTYSYRDDISKCRGANVLTQ